MNITIVTNTTKQSSNIKNLSNPKFDTNIPAITVLIIRVKTKILDYIEYL